MSNNRTTSVKHLDESRLYGLLHDGSSTGAYKMGHIQTVKVTGASACTAENGDDYSDFAACCALVDGYVRMVTPGNPHTDLVITIDGQTVTIPAGSPENSGFLIALGSGTPKDLTSTVAITSGGVAGIVFEILYVPVFTSSHLIDYVESVNNTPAQTYRLIKNRGTVTHRKRIQNRENSISINGKYQNFNKNMSRFGGNYATLMQDIEDDNAGLISETRYWGLVNVKTPDTAGSGGDTDTTQSVDATYERYMNVVGEA